MKNQKLNLLELKVQSFLTNVKKSESEIVKGGTSIPLTEIAELCNFFPTMVGRDPNCANHR